MAGTFFWFGLFFLFDDFRLATAHRPFVSASPGFLGNMANIAYTGL